MKQLTNYIEEIRYNSCESLINDFLFKDKQHSLSQYIFRGLGRNEYELLPSILRKNCRDEWRKTFSKLWEKVENESELNQHFLELNLIKQFFDYSDDQGLVLPNTEIFRQNLNIVSIYRQFNKWLPYELYEIASLAQHYGIPTRLLDWTYDFLTAFFFATSSGLKNFRKDDDVIIWGLNLLKMEEISWNSPQKNFPLKTIIPPRHLNANLNAQAGLLTFWETQTDRGFDQSRTIDREPLDIKISKEFDNILNSQLNHITFKSPFNFLLKIVLPHTELKNASNLLSKLKYTESKIFPGYDGVVKRIKNKVYLNYIDL